MEVNSVECDHDLKKNRHFSSNQRFYYRTIVRFVGLISRKFLSVNARFIVLLNLFSRIFDFLVNDNNCKVGNTKEG